jgi:hypothetical protein
MRSPIVDSGKTRSLCSQPTFPMFWVTLNVETGENKNDIIINKIQQKIGKS